MMILPIAAAVAVLAAQPTGATSDNKDDRYDPAKVICKSTKITGTRTRRERTCMTRKQWNDLADRTRAHAEEQVNYSTRLSEPPR